MKFLKEKFFYRLPKNTGFFKQKKKVKCAMCLKCFDTENILKRHQETVHQDILEFGVEMVNPGEYKISNKLVNLISMYCFINPSEIKTIMDIIEASKFDEEGIFKQPSSTQPGAAAASKEEEKENS